MNLDSLIYEYEQCKLQAHNAYMHGMNARAAKHYDQAFHLSRRITEQLRDSDADTHSNVEAHQSKTAMLRLLDACQNCFEFGPIFTDSQPPAYLELAQDDLLEVINSTEPRQLRAFALGIYAEVATLAAKHQALNPSEQTQKLCKQFCALWFIHAPMLIDFH